MNETSDTVPAGDTKSETGEPETVSGDEIIEEDIQYIGEIKNEEERCDEANRYLKTKGYYGMELEAKLRFIDELIERVKENKDEDLKTGMRAIACRITKESRDEEEIRKARELCEAAGGINAIRVVGTLRPAKKIPSEYTDVEANNSFQT